MTFLTRCYIFSSDIEELDQPSTNVDVKSEAAEEPGPSRKRVIDSDDEEDETNYLAPEPDLKKIRTGEETHYIPDEYAVVKREFAIVKGENELLPVFKSCRDFYISSGIYYGPIKTRAHKFNFSITLTKGETIERVRTHLENLLPGNSSLGFYANPKKTTINIFPMLKKDDDGELCVLALFKGRRTLLSRAALSDLGEVSMQAVVKSQKIIKNPSTTEFKNSVTHIWKVVIQELKINPKPKQIPNTEIDEPRELMFFTPKK